MSKKIALGVIIAAVLIIVLAITWGNSPPEEGNRDTGGLSEPVNFEEDGIIVYQRYEGGVLSPPFFRYKDDEGLTGTSTLIVDSKSVCADGEQSGPCKYTPGSNFMEGREVTVRGTQREDQIFVTQIRAKSF